jgi:exodeoxyribonuclease VII small subunit
MTGVQTLEMAGRRIAVSDLAGAEAAADISTLSFDDALLELQRTVTELEQGGLPLERSIALYERGVALHERCAALLGQAELRVQKLLERSSGALEVAEIRPADASDPD